MLVKSMLVPLVDATDVPLVITLLAIDDTFALVITGAVSVLLVKVSVVSLPMSVVVASGIVNVRSVFVFGAATVSVPLPLAWPVSAILLMGASPLGRGG